MPFRARVVTPEKAFSITSVTASERAWAFALEVREAARSDAGYALRLPCCGAPAVPRDGGERARHFAHAPGTAARCPERDRDPRRYEVMARLIPLLEADDWVVTPDEEMGGAVADLLLEAPSGALRLVLQLESGRPDGAGVARRHAAFEAAGVDETLWFAPPRSRARRAIARGHVHDIPPGVGPEGADLAAAAAAHALRARVARIERDRATAVRALGDARLRLRCAACSTVRHRSVRELRIPDLGQTLAQVQFRLRCPECGGRGAWATVESMAGCSW